MCARARACVCVCVRVCHLVKQMMSSVDARSRDELETR